MASNYKTGASLNLTSFEMQLLSRSPLFRGAGESGIGEMLSCLGAEERSYEKEEMIYRAGNTVTSLGVVMHGSVMIVNDDLWGNRSILDRVEPGQIFAETYACVPGEKLLVDVFAAEVTEVLFLNVGKMLSQCPNSCGHHTQLIRNLLAISAQKNLQLSRRIFNTSSKSIRGRLLSYLSDQAVKMRARDLISHSIASSSPTIWVWTGRRCRQSWGKCSGKGFWNLEKITFIYMKRLEACRLQTKIPCQEH